MTPLDLARSMSTSDQPRARATAVALVARGLSDPDPSDPFRQPWPLPAAVLAAAEYLDLDPTPELRADAERIAPTLSAAILNRGA